MEMFQGGFEHCETVSEISFALSGGGVATGTVYVLHGDKATLKFVSDGSTVEQGFRILASAVPPGFINFLMCIVL